MTMIDDGRGHDGAGAAADRRRGGRLGGGALLLALAMLAAGCASPVPDTESMLAAAGFQMRLADTPQKQAQLTALPPQRLLMQQFGKGDHRVIGYLYADPEFCHCVYVGTERAFQAFQQMAFQRRIADDQLMAAEMNQDAAMNSWMWGPGFGYGGFVGGPGFIP